MADATVETVSARQTTSRGGRGRRTRGRGDRSAQVARSSPQNEVPAPSRAAGGRRFGGQLTSTDTTPDTMSNTLRAQATTFVPASIVPNTHKRPNTRNPSSPVVATPSPKSHIRSRRLSRSNAPDLATRIHEDIAHNLYECAICSNEVGRNSKIWSCDTCWTIFHIGCIKKWSKNEGSAVHRTRPDEHEGVVGKQWRCPGCNLPKETLPSNYTCWCEKEIDPKPITSLPPHSCGQTCARERKFPKVCPHPCDEICHAGPCPPCTTMGPEQSCFCGKQSSTRRCAETQYEAGWSCGAICGDVMACGEHMCQRPCHEGVCGACVEPVSAKCYCGKVEKQLACNARSEERDSHAWVGSFDCGQECGRSMDCGKHFCQQTCHPQDEEAPHCSRSPDVITHCPCGKTALVELTHATRQVCTDPIPSCDKKCGKQHTCGHLCERQCHAGECPPCLKKIPITCRCGRNTFETPCYGGSTESPWCTRVCRVTMNCGRHECGERCCPGERHAAERIAAKRRHKHSLTMDTSGLLRNGDFEAEHICTRTCDRPLKCGNHTCPDLCHRGPCASCKEAIFDDISCNCGRTTLQAPLPCGTRPPPCSFPCRRAKACGHPQVAHNCHTDAEECPKCPFLVERPCLCSKKVLKNQPCWRTDVLCGLVCGRTLKCGSHTCRSTCHRPGECEDARVHCQQECGKEKKICGHPCEQACHAPFACKEDKLCPSVVVITCDCQRVKEKVQCKARAGNPDPAGRKTSLKCDDECARLERNRRLAAALHIPDDHENDHVPYSTETLTMYLRNVPWCHEQEEIMRLLAADEAEKRYRFKPMKPQQRAFVHSLAADFGFDSESLDPEPHRHVLLFKTPKFVSAPMKTLAQAARIRRTQLASQTPVEGTITPKRADEARTPDYNGLLLRQIRFGLVEVELRPVLRQSAPTTDFDVVFMSDGETIALLPKNEWTSQEQITTLLTTLQPTISAAVTREGIASSAVLCEFDLSGGDAEPVVLHEAGSLSSSASVIDGWSSVAAKRATPRSAPTVAPIGQKSSFMVLASKLAEAKKKRQEEAAMEKKRKALQAEPVVDDWSAEMEREAGEEEERQQRQQQEGSGLARASIGENDTAQPDQLAVD